MGLWTVKLSEGKKQQDEKHKQRPADLADVGQLVDGMDTDSFSDTTYVLLQSIGLDVDLTFDIDKVFQVFVHVLDERNQGNLHVLILQTFEDFIPFLLVLYFRGRLGQQVVKVGLLLSVIRLCCCFILVVIVVTELVGVGISNRCILDINWA